MKKGRIGKGVRDTQIHIAKNLPWSGLKIIFFSSLNYHHGPIYYWDLGGENSTGARNGGCYPQNGWGRKCDQGALSLFLVKLQAAKSSGSLLLT